MEIDALRDNHRGYEINLPVNWENSRRVPAAYTIQASELREAAGQSRSSFSFSANRSTNKSRFGRGHAAWREHRVDRDWGRFEIVKHHFQRALIDEIAYLPERAIPDAQAMTRRLLERGDRVVGFENNRSRPLS